MSFISWITNLGMGASEPPPVVETDERPAILLMNDIATSELVLEDEADALILTLDERPA